MARSSKLKLDPNKCDRCGRCDGVCGPGALKVGASYIFVDWRTCDGCGKCVDACDRGAITLRGTEVRASTGAPAASAASAGRERGGSAAGGGRPKARKRPKKGQPKGSSRAASGHLYDWTVLEAMAVLAVVFVAFIAKDAVLASEWARGLGPSQVVWLRVGVLAVFYTIQVGALVGLAMLRGIDLIDGLGLGPLDTPWRQKLDSVAAVAGLLLATRVAAWVYGVTVQALGWDPPAVWNSALTDVFGPDALGLTLAVLMVVVVGPVVEEVVFRGVLLRAFEARLGPWVAIVASAALFAGYHFNFWLFIPTMVLGVAAGWLATTRESLWPAIVLHALYNVVPVSMAFYLVA